MARDTIKRQRVSVKGGLRLPMRGSLDKAIGGFTAPSSPRKHNLQVRHRLIGTVSPIRSIQMPSCGLSCLLTSPHLLKSPARWPCCAYRSCPGWESDCDTICCRRGSSARLLVSLCLFTHDDVLNDFVPQYTGSPVDEGLACEGSGFASYNVHQWTCAPGVPPIPNNP